MFDRVLLMAEGRTAYLGQANEALSFFANQGLPCPPNYNPADFYIHTLATIPDQEADSRKKSVEICNAYETSDNWKRMLEQIKANQPSSMTQQGIDMPPVEVKRSPYKASWFAQFRAVFWRSVLTVLREPSILKAKAFQSIVSGYVTKDITKNVTKPLLNFVLQMHIS